MILAILAPIAQHANRSRIFGIAGGYGTAFAIGSQVLPRIKAKAGHVADAAGAPSLVLRPMSLCGIFNDQQIVPARNFHNGVHVSSLTIEVDWQNCFGARGDSRFNQRRVHSERAGINIYEHRTSACVYNRGNAGHERERDGNDFIAGTDSCSKERQMQGAGSGVQSDALGYSAIRSEIPFKGLDFSTQNELATI